MNNILDIWKEELETWVIRGDVVYAVVEDTRIERCEDLNFRAGRE